MDTQVELMDQLAIEWLRKRGKLDTTVVTQGDDNPYDCTVDGNPMCTMHYDFDSDGSCPGCGEDLNYEEQEEDACPYCDFVMEPTDEQLHDYARTEAGFEKVLPIYKDADAMTVENFLASALARLGYELHFSSLEEQLYEKDYK